MAESLIVLLSVLTYLGLAVCVARVLYQRRRPYDEPISCSSKCARLGIPHRDACYYRPGYSDDQFEAAVVSTTGGLLWPAVGAWLLASGAVTARTRPLPEETAAKIDRLERELAIGPGAAPGAPATPAPESLFDAVRMASLAWWRSR